MNDNQDVPSCVLFSFLPLKLGLLLGEYLEAFNVMDGFTGSRKKNWRPLLWLTYPQLHNICFNEEVSLLTECTWRPQALFFVCYLQPVPLKIMLRSAFLFFKFKKKKSPFLLFACNCCGSDCCCCCFSYYITSDLLWPHVWTWDNPLLWIAHHFRRVSVAELALDGEVRAEKKPECLQRWGVLRTQSSGFTITLFSDLALLKLCHLAQKGQPPTSSSHRCLSFSPQRCLFLQPWVFREQLPDLLKAPQGHCVGELSCTFLYNQRPVILACMLSHFSCVLLFCDCMDCSPPGSSAHEILQARILE